MAEYSKSKNDASPTKSAAQSETLELQPAALYGVAGKAVREIAPHTSIKKQRAFQW